MTAILQSKDYTGKPVLYMAMESSNTKWKLGFSNGGVIVHSPPWI
ncbi:MAG: hypothetical protein BECKG1743D_GA0114223_111772 [Candidatus Kentron sp. G]|nr:MAG: hypothetical protein BECKG1743E_GA0114224_111762 [Candidatus Kentron sp. G]VFN07886.1 MAG: hypothetical protein BECKG1743D_GA0114223_111772 [Candidatus Kentron sp. G]